MVLRKDWWIAPAAAMVRRFCSAIPIAITDITWATSTANITAPRQEEQKWKTERDPIANFGKWLIEQKLADAAALDQVQAELEAEMKKAVAFAIAAPYPSVDEVEQDVYA